MQILSSADRLQAFEEVLHASSRVDLFVAALTCGPALSALLAAAESCVTLRVLISTDAATSDPVALALLAERAEVRTCQSRPGTVTGGVGLFTSKEGEARVWFGLPAMTLKGIVFDRPLITEGDARAADQAAAWYEETWRDALPFSLVSQEWVPPMPDLAAGVGANASFGHPFDILQAGDVSDWDSYIVALERADRFRRAAPLSGFTLFDEFASLPHLLCSGASVIFHTDWRAPLTETAVEHVLGRRTDGLDGYVALGGAKKRTVAKGILLDPSEEDSEIRVRLQGLLRAMADLSVDDAIDEAGQVLREAESVDGIDAMTITRLLTMARPDVCVAVHAGSSKGFAAFSGLPATPVSLAKAGNYVKLLTTIAETEWHAAPRPASSVEGFIWDRRAAVMELLVGGWSV